MRAVNLVPTDQRSGAKQGVGPSGGVAYAVLGLMAGLAIVVYLYGNARSEISSSHTKVASLTAQAQGVEANAAQLAPYTSFIALRDEREQAVATLANTRFDWAHAFHEFSRVLPPTVTLTALGGSIAATVESPAAPAAAPSTGTSSASTAAPSTGAAAPAASSTSTSAGAAAAPAGASTPSTTPTPVASATPAGSVPAFTLTGCAATQAGVAATLERLRLIDGVSTVTLQSSIKGTSGGGTSSTGCPGDYPVFTVLVAFDPLPAPATTSSSSTSPSTTASPASATAPAAASSAPAAAAVPTTPTAGAK